VRSKERASPPYPSFNGEDHLLFFYYYSITDCSDKKLFNPMGIISVAYTVISFINQFLLDFVSIPISRVVHIYDEKNQQLEVE
jgi:hypothetical protein